MTPRRKRLTFVLVGMAALALATTLILRAFDGNLVYFFSPSDVAEGMAPEGKTFRLGGLVEEGSLQRENDGLTVHFVVTDKVKQVPVVFTGILPDLFTEGQGMVAQGRLGADGVFRAKDVLAKHDETYMPPEVADSLERAKESQKGSQTPASMSSNI